MGLRFHPGTGSRRRRLRRRPQSVLVFWAKDSVVVFDEGGAEVWHRPTFLGVTRESLNSSQELPPTVFVSMV